MRKVVQISLDDKGAILLSARVREQLHLSPGMTLVVETGEQGGMRLRVEKNSAPLVKKGGVLVARVTALSDIENVTRNERERRVLELVQRTGI